MVTLQLCVQSIYSVDFPSRHFIILSKRTQQKINITTQGRKKMFSGGGADVCVLIRALARGKIFS